MSPVTEAQKAPVKAKKFTIPKKLGAVADLLFTTRNERLALQKQVEELAKKEQALREHLIDTLPKSEANGITGALVRATIVKDVVPTLTDWDALTAYVKKNNAFDLLQRRISAAAVQERWEDDKEVPGVAEFVVVKVSLNKV